jgi:hypothetical protein
MYNPSYPLSINFAIFDSLSHPRTSEGWFHEAKLA